MERRQFLLTSAAASALIAGASVTLVACNYNWITTALNDIPTIVDIVTQIATLVAAALGAGTLTPAIAAAIQTAVAAAQTALALLKTIIADYQANPSATLLEKARLTLLDIQTNLGAILSAAHIDNIALRATITAVVGVAVGVITEILNLFPAPAPKTALVVKAPVQSPSYAKKPTSKPQIVTTVNGIFTEYGYGQYAVLK